ncbi:hypothetical protein ASG04_04495 [Curtobacterium sp. Leaf183]|uniref:hypothetical protein n=1 Tax=Curtobacterium sp. Leaf183 TaxID=1736291 RepID=UPI0006FECB6C|nr:hypothetical protein [Curtobacterium sp. Leaf183]KQS09862.1 hypothetical protein ASG04_04495 [Curtobacterium sp. Leaf183]
MQTSRIAITAGIAGALAMLAAGCTAADEPAPSRSAAGTVAPSGVAATPDPGRYLAILDRPFSPDDALPDDAVDPPDTMVANSQRLAVTRDGTTYWIAADAGGGACLIAYDPDPASVDNWTTCGGVVHPESVIVNMTGDEGRRTALVSDGFAGEGDGVLHPIAQNVWVS